MVPFNRPTRPFRRRALRSGFCLLFCLAGFTKAISARTLDLKEALDLALEKSPDYDAALQNQKIDTLAEKNSVAAFYPSLDFDTSYGLQDVYPQVAPTDPAVSNVSITLSENLYDNGTSITNRKIAKLNREIGNLNLKLAQETLSFSLVKAFYTYSQNVKAKEVRKAQLEITQKQFDLVSRYYRQGVKTRKDYLAFESTAQQAEVDLLLADNAVRTSVLDIREILGSRDVQDNDDFKVIEAPATEPEIPREFPPLENSLEYQIHDREKQIDELNVEFSKRKYWPQLFLTSSIEYGNSQYLGPQSSWTAYKSSNANILLDLKMNLWDWGILRRQVEMAESTRRQNDDVAEKKILDIKKLMESTMLQMEKLSKASRLQKALLNVEKTSHDLLESEYRDGQVSYLDIVSELNNLRDAELSYLQSRYALLANIAEYKFYEGKLYEDLKQGR